MLKTTREQLEQLKALEARACGSVLNPGDPSLEDALGKALVALLHDAGVAHRLVDKIQKAAARANAIAPTSGEAVRNKCRDLGLLEALLSEAKGAE